MKEITILQKNSESIIVKDNDNSKINEYAKKLSQLLEISNITILETSEANVVLRPHEITSIKVKDVQMENEITLDADSTKISVQASEEQVEDVLTDFND